MPLPGSSADPALPLGIFLRSCSTDALTRRGSDQELNLSKPLPEGKKGHKAHAEQPAQLRRLCARRNAESGGPGCSGCWAARCPPPGEVLRPEPGSRGRNQPLLSARKKNNLACTDSLAG